MPLLDHSETARAKRKFFEDFTTRGAARPGFFYALRTKKSLAKVKLHALHTLYQGFVAHGFAKAVY